MIHAIGKKVETLKIVSTFILSIHIQIMIQNFAVRENGRGRVGKKKFDKENTLIILLISFIFHTKSM